MNLTYLCNSKSILCELKESNACKIVSQPQGNSEPSPRQALKRQWISTKPRAQIAQSQCSLEQYKNRNPVAPGISRTASPVSALTPIPSGYSESSHCSTLALASCTVSEFTRAHLWALATEWCSQEPSGTSNNAILPACPRLKDLTAYVGRVRSWSSLTIEDSPAEAYSISCFPFGEMLVHTGLL